MPLASVRQTLNILSTQYRSECQCNVYRLLCTAAYVTLSMLTMEDQEQTERRAAHDDIAAPFERCAFHCYDEFCSRRPSKIGGSLRIAKQVRHFAFAK